jgi:hypothetical protein
MSRKRVKPKKDALVEFEEFAASLKVGHSARVPDFKELNADMGHVVQIGMDAPLLTASFISSDHAALKRLQGLIGGELIGDQLAFDDTNVTLFTDACASLLDPDCDHRAPSLEFLGLVRAIARLVDADYSPEAAVTWMALLDRVHNWLHTHVEVGDDAVDTMVFVWHKEGAKLGK